MNYTESFRSLDELCKRVSHLAAYPGSYRVNRLVREHGVWNISYTLGV